MKSPLLHPTCHVCGCAWATGPSFRRVRYIGMSGADFEIDVPTWHCSACSCTWETMPEELGCMPTSPVTPRTWVDERLLQYLMAFKALGVSDTHFAEVLSRDGRSSSVDDRLLSGAFLYYVRHFRVLDNVDELALKTTMSPDASSPSRSG